MAYAEALQAIADPTRRQVFERLRRGPLPVGRLAAGLQVTRPAVSQHLRVLERAGLVHARREGTRRIYAVDRRGLEELRRYLDSLWDDVLESFARDAEIETGARAGRRARGGAGRAGKKAREERT
jgi:DNA-binding transcriptional ArsR family regulator